ncbi:MULTISPECIES: SLATT domain-containing protein [Capnocytophaga]|uniref:SLATT domain-containing protein n=1 Tax=Capnocytophaga TaxID=1016 RepID=UPI00370DCDFE
MDKKQLKQYIAKTAYNIGFGAKKNFASYDIIRNTNEYISMISMAIGILALVFETFNEKTISALLLIAGIVGLYISKFESMLNDYDEIGVTNTKHFNELNVLYYKVDEIDANTDEILSQVKGIENDFYSKTISKQVYFSGWYAHYKFFYQFQSEWIVKELKLTFWKDKIPSSLKVFIFLILLGIILFLILCLLITNIKSNSCVIYIS